jgi:hypothetical protein
MEKKYWQIVIIGAIAFIVISLGICSGLFSDRTAIYTNDEKLSMKIWLQNAGVPMKSSSPKKYQVYQFIVVSTVKLERLSEQDGLWETCSKTDCVYYLFTDTKP